jgi:hypothetical protein
MLIDSRPWLFYLSLLSILRFVRPCVLSVVSFDMIFCWGCFVCDYVIPGYLLGLLCLSYVRFLLVDAIHNVGRYFPSKRFPFVLTLFLSKSHSQNAQLSAH